MVCKKSVEIAISWRQWPLAEWLLKRIRPIYGRRIATSHDGYVLTPGSLAVSPENPPLQEGNGKRDTYLGASRGLLWEIKKCWNKWTLA